MFDDLVRQFLGSDAATKTIQAVTTQQRLTPEQAQTAVRATAEGTGEALRSGNFDLGSLAGAIGGGGGVLGGIAQSLGLGQKQTGGLPSGLVQQVTDYVANKTGLSAGIAAAVVTMALPKVLEFAKNMMSSERGTSPGA